MIDLEKILVKIVLLLVTVLFIVLLFNSCKTHKQMIKTQIDSTATEAVKVECITTDNSKTDEDYTEIVYVLDSSQSVVIDNSLFNFQDGKVNYGSALFKVKEIKVKNAHISTQNNIDNKIYATEEKKAEIKEKSTNFAKSKPNTTRNLRLVAVCLVSIVVLLALWRFYQKLN